jgi:hypothetical protein
MGKVDKKRRKLEERINILQEEMNLALTKKSSSTAEINVGEFQRRILELRKQLNEM